MRDGEEGITRDEMPALDLLKYTLEWEIVRKIRFDSGGDFKITLEFHFESKSWRETQDMWGRDETINAELTRVDLREIRFDSVAERGKMGIIPQFTGNCCQ